METLKYLQGDELLGHSVYTALAVFPIGLGIISYSGWIGNILAYKCGIGVKVAGGAGYREEQQKMEGRKQTVHQEQRESARIWNTAPSSRNNTVF